VSTQPESSPPQALRDVVLLHGGWHGGWVWQRLAPLLSAAGHRIHTPTLTGLGDRAPEFHAEVGLQTHVDDILQLVLDLRSNAVTLLGHSYGGSIITVVADQLTERIAALVYLDAVIPTDGIPDWQRFPRERQESMLAGAQGLDGLRVPPPDPALWGLVPGTPAHQELQQRLTPHPIKTMMDAPRLSGRWQTVQRKHYLLAAGPPRSRFSDVHSALTKQPGWTTALVAGGHEMMWTHAHELAGSLLPILDAGT
jgi:pimeloyl-ACP methyl ester carboxylesterase